MASIFKYRDGWRAQIRRKGSNPIHKDFVLKAQAQRWAADMERKFEEGVVELQPVKRNETVREVFEKYRDEVTPTKGGASREKDNIDRFLRQITFANKKIQGVSADDIDEWKKARLKKVSGSTVNRELNTVSAIFTYAIQDLKIRMAHPAKGLKRPKNNPHRTRRVPADEVAMLWKAFGTEIKLKRDYAPYMFELARETAMRLSEISRLRWEDVNLEKGWVLLKKTKNGESRYAVLTPRAKQLLLALPRKGEKIFPLTSGYATEAIRDKAVELGIENLHFHDTRHEATTQLAKKLHVLELATVTGHKDLKKLQIYYNPTPEELAEKVKD